MCPFILVVFMKEYIKPKIKELCLYFANQILITSLEIIKDDSDEDDNWLA